LTWRPVLAGIVTLTEIRTSWSFSDLMYANKVVDEQEVQEKKETDELKQSFNK